jgi:hypothetical protein
LGGWDVEGVRDALGVGRSVERVTRMARGRCLGLREGGFRRFLFLLSLLSLLLARVDVSGESKSLRKK